MTTQPNPIVEALESALNWIVSAENVQFPFRLETPEMIRAAIPLARQQAEELEHLRTAFAKEVKIHASRIGELSDAKSKMKRLKALMREIIPMVEWTANTVTPPLKNWIGNRWLKRARKELDAEHS